MARLATLAAWKLGSVPGTSSAARRRTRQAVGGLKGSAEARAEGDPGLADGMALSALDLATLREVLSFFLSFEEVKPRMRDHFLEPLRRGATQSRSRGC